MPAIPSTTVSANASKVGDPIPLTDFPKVAFFALTANKVAFSPTQFGCIAPSDVMREIAYGTDENRMLIVDLTCLALSQDDSVNSSEPRQHFKFRGAYYFPCEDAATEAVKLFNDQPKDLWFRLMTAEYVVFHCRFCENRSPTFAAKWARKVKESLAAKDPAFAKYRRDQKICLMSPGFEVFSPGKQLGAAELSPFATANFAPQFA
ncbi:hypothetical protein JCM6882_000643 [Rhodosporidiobolus microsporus]